MNRDRRTVLHVDDDPDLLRLVNASLSKAGYTVISLDDPTQALQKLLETDASVVLLDVDMPAIDGLSLLKQIKVQDGGVQVVILTGMVSMSTVLRSMRWGAEACVFKPITDMQHLMSCLEAAFVKLDHWWETLVNLRLLQRKERAQAPEAETTTTN